MPADRQRDRRSRAAHRAPRDRTRPARRTHARRPGCASWSTRICPPVRPLRSASWSSAPRARPGLRPAALRINRAFRTCAPETGSHVASGAAAAGMVRRVQRTTQSSMATIRTAIERLVIATHNAGKLRELRDLLRPLWHRGRSRPGDLGLPEPEETGTTFLANAELKAEAAARGAGLPALADDSGLCVDALDGAPGIYSARWAGARQGFRRRHGADRRASRRTRRRHAPPSGGAPFRRRAGAGLAGRAGAKPSRARSSERWSRRRAARWASATIRCSCRTATRRTFGEMSRRAKSTASRPTASEALSHRARAFQQLARRCFGATSARRERA